MLRRLPDQRRHEAVCASARLRNDHHSWASRASQRDFRPAVFASAQCCATASARRRRCSASAACRSAASSTASAPFGGSAGGTSAPDERQAYRCW